MLGVPALFLDDDANDSFPELIGRGEAQVVELGALMSALAAMADRPSRLGRGSSSIEDSLQKIERLAQDFALLCDETAHEQFDRGARIIRQRQAPRAVRRERSNRAS